MSGPPRLLIVEDNFIIGALIEEAAEGAGFEVTDMVANHAAALASCDDNPPHIATMDLELARGDKGLKVAQDIWDKHKIPVLFISAYDMDRTLTTESVPDNFGWIDKPFLVEDLEEKLSGIRQTLLES